MKIKRHYPSGFDISIGVGKIFWAKNIEEVGLAIEHYFRHHGSKIHNVDDKNCPLCRG